MNTLFENETIRALSWNQPYADLMLHGKIETRRYLTKVRGKVLICSCKKPYPTSMLFSISGPMQMLRIIETLNWPFNASLNGSAIAIGDLVDCRRMTQEDEDKCFVKYHSDLWCWIFDNVKPITPFPWQGKQGWSVIKNDELVTNLLAI